MVRNGGQTGRGAGRGTQSKAPAVDWSAQQLWPELMCQEDRCWSSLRLER